MWNEHSHDFTTFQIVSNLGILGISPILRNSPDSHLGNLQNIILVLTTANAASGGDP